MIISNKNKTYPLTHLENHKVSNKLRVKPKDTKMPKEGYIEAVLGDRPRSW